MNILIVEDEYLARAELNHLLEQDERITTIREADSIQEALSVLLKHPIDIVYLDIHLTDENGMELADLINEVPNPPVIVFATAYDQYALKAFEKNACDYLLKPFEEKRVKASLERAIKEAEFSSANVQKSKSSYDIVPIQTEDKIYMIKISSLIMIEAMQGKVILYTESGQYESKDTLHFCEDKLPANSFMRVHRSYIIHLAKIQSIEPWFNNTYQVTLENGFKAPVSRSYIQAFRKKVNI